MSLNPAMKEADIWIGRGDEFAKSGDNSKALECYGKAIEINPRASFAYFKRSQVFVALGRNQEAISDLGSAIALNLIIFRSPISSAVLFIPNPSNTVLLSKISTKQ